MNERKTTELISYLTARSEGDPRFSLTRLSALLFCCDFTAYISEAEIEFCKQLERSYT
jgi:hypothetical protein